MRLGGGNKSPFLPQLLKAIKITKIIRSFSLFIMILIVSNFAVANVTVSVGDVQVDGYTNDIVVPVTLSNPENWVGGLQFDLIVDEDLKVQESYGVWREKTNYGKTYMGTVRSTFVIDSEGIISIAKYNVRATGHVERIATEMGITVEG